MIDLGAVVLVDTNLNLIYKTNFNSVEELALSKVNKERLLAYEKQGLWEHLILVGAVGTGKTSVARILGKASKGKFEDVTELDCIDLTFGELKKKVAGWTTGWFGKTRLIILDEFHRLDSKAQGLITKPCEDFADKLMFIICCNNYDTIIEPIKSRFASLNFNIGSNASGRITLVPYLGYKLDEWKKELVKCASKILKKNNLSMSDKDIDKVLNNNSQYIVEPRKFIQAIYSELRMRKK